jgi:hypothetical protein
MDIIQRLEHFETNQLLQGDEYGAEVLNKAVETIGELRGERDALKEWRDGLYELVDKQAEDEALWFDADYITEAYIQEALRKLHYAIEATRKEITNATKKENAR